MTTHALKLTSPGDLIAVVPYILGFHPSHSIVVLCLHDAHLGLIQRLDLPTNGAEGRVVNALLPPLVREHPDAVLLIGYESTVGESLPVLQALQQALRSAGVTIKDRLIVHDDRWRSLDCDNPGCCPMGGSPVPEPADLPAIAAEYVGQEVVPLPDRQTLVRQLEPGLVAEELIRLLGEQATGTQDPIEVFAAWSTILDAGDEARSLTTSDAAAAARSLRDIQVRDGLVAWLTPGTLDPSMVTQDVRDQLSQLHRDWDDNDGDSTAVIAQNRIQARLIRLCAMLPDQHAAPALTVLGCFTWWRGDGALTRVALDRALRCDPNYRLALLLQHMVDLAIRTRTDR